MLAENQPPGLQSLRQ